MLYAAVPSEISHIPADPADAYNSVFDQVDAYAAMLQHPQAASGQDGKNQRNPFPPSVIDDREQKKAYDKIHHQQNFTGCQGPAVICRNILALLGYILVQKIQKKLHVGLPYFPIPLFCLLIMHSFYIMCNSYLQNYVQLANVCFLFGISCIKPYQHKKGSPLPERFSVFITLGSCAVHSCPIFHVRRQPNIS